MARFLFAMWEGGGTVPPELAVARRLIARGHVVHVLGDPTIAASAERAHTFDQATGSDVILLLTAEAFDFPGPPLPSNVKYVGPQLDDPLWADPWEWPWGADDVRPLVLVGFSTTYQAQSGTLARVVHALGRLPVRALVTTGPALDASALGPAPDNVVIVSSAPHAQVMTQAAVVVTHAGHGTVLKTLSHGVPMLCMPMGRDQGDNAARVVWHEAGLRLNRAASSDAIADTLRTLLTDDRYRRGARAMADRIRAESRGDRVVEELERLVRG